MLDYHERAAERLAEMAGELRAEGAHAEQAGRLPDRQPRADDEAAGPDQARQVAARDGRGGPARLRGRAPAGCSRELGYEVDVTPRDRICRTRSGGRRHVVTKWFNRGQAFVSRYVRDALDARGHETFILARPTKDKGPMAAHIDRTGVWDQPGVTEASDWEVPFEEYERWIADNGIEVVHWDNCYQHEEIARLRESGVQDRRPLRLGDVLARGRRAGEARLRRPLLDDPLRAASATRRWGSRAPTCSGACIRELLEAADEAQARPRATRATTSSASTSPAPCSGRASRTRRSSRPSGRRRATTCG